MSARIIVHSLAQAEAALAAAAALDLPVTLMSAPGAGAYAGVAWFQALVAEAAAAHPGARFTAVLDCGEAAGAALAALRLGLRHLRFSGNAAARASLSAIAVELGATIEEDAPCPALDLKDARDPAALCRAALAGTASR